MHNTTRYDTTQCNLAMRDMVGACVQGGFIFRLCVRAKINKNKGLPNKQLRNIKLGWADFQIGCLFVINMLEFLVGVACGAKPFL